MAGRGVVRAYDEAFPDHGNQLALARAGGVVGGGAVAVNLAARMAEAGLRYTAQNVNRWVREGRIAWDEYVAARRGAERQRLMRQNVPRGQWDGIMERLNQRARETFDYFRNWGGVGPPNPPPGGGDDGYDPFINILRPATKVRHRNFLHDGTYGNENFSAGVYWGSGNGRQNITVDLCDIVAGTGAHQRRGRSVFIHRIIVRGFFIGEQSGHNDWVRCFILWDKHNNSHPRHSSNIHRFNGDDDQRIFNSDTVSLGSFFASRGHDPLLASANPLKQDAYVATMYEGNYDRYEIFEDQRHPVHGNGGIRTNWFTMQKRFNPPVRVDYDDADGCTSNNFYACFCRSTTSDFTSSAVRGCFSTSFSDTGS